MLMPSDVGIINHYVRPAFTKPRFPIIFLLLLAALFAGLHSGLRSQIMAVPAQETLTACLFKLTSVGSAKNPWMSLLGRATGRPAIQQTQQNNKNR
jgi:hypothetical protein